MSARSRPRPARATKIGISPSPPRSCIDGAREQAAAAAPKHTQLSVEASDYGPEPLESRELEAKADRAGAGLSRRRGAQGGRAPARRLSPAGVRRRSAQAQARARQGDCRRGVPVAGRRLRREFRRAFGRQHPRFLPRLPADGGGDDLCGGLADHQGRARRRTVRQAALVEHRDDRRRHAALLPRRHRQRHRIQRRGAHARAAPAVGGLSPVGGDAQSASRLRHRRLRQSRKRASLDARLRQGQPAVGALSGSRRPHHRDARLHARDRPRRRGPSGTARHRFLHLARGAVARLRAGDDAARTRPRATITRPPATCCGSATARVS